MKMKGPDIFLAQFLRDEEPYNNLENIGKWAANLGYKGVQIPTWDKRVLDLDKAAECKGYCDELRGKLADVGWAVLEWECCVRSPEQGAREGAPFISSHIIETTEVAFDDFAGGKSDVERNRLILGLEQKKPS